MSDLHDVVAALAAASPSAPIRLRQGSIVAVAANGTATITIGGSATEVSGVKVAGSCCPIPGAACWILTDGRDLFVFSTLAPAGPAWARGTRSTGQALGTGTFTAVTLPVQNVDTAGMFTAGEALITVTVPGIYTVSGFVEFAANATGNRHLRIMHGTTVVSGASTPPIASSHVARLNVSAQVKAAIGDTFNLSAYQSSGGNLNVDEAALSAVWIGPSS